MQDPSTTSSISRLLKRLMKRGKGARSGPETVCRGKWASGERLASSGWKRVAGWILACRVRRRVGAVVAWEGVRSV
jgi:hypothetical protein